MAVPTANAIAPTQPQIEIGAAFPCRICQGKPRREGDVPYARNAGSHYEVTGAGPPLVLQHGFMCSLDEWDELGYVAALSAQYRLILIDARGHGSSDKPHDMRPTRSTAG
jgi:pimeloyl-ACP methyl ester carboxylesterase